MFWYLFLIIDGEVQSEFSHRPGSWGEAECLVTMGAREVRWLKEGAQLHSREPYPHEGGWNIALSNDGQSIILRCAEKE